jgi:tetratricopeptide (TPR) repeat protein
MPDSQSSDKLASIQKLIQGHQFDVAYSQLENFLTISPNDIDALYMAAICSRHQQRFDAAQQYLDQLFSLKSEYCRAHQEQGHLYRQQKYHTEALQAYQYATQINPALESSWSAQAVLCQTLNKPELGQQALMQLKRLKSLPKAIVSITDLLALGRLAKAEELCRQVLARQPRNIEAMRLLASIASQMGALSEAELLLESAVVFDPDNTQVRVDYVQLLRRRQKFKESLDQAGQLLATAPDNPQLKSLYAIESMQMGDYDTALEFFDSVLQQLPNDATTLTSRGHALKTTGNTAAAIDSYRAATQAKPDYGEAYYSLANLKTYQFTEQELKDIQVIDKRHKLGLMDRVYISFALGKAFEDLKDFSRAFDYYQRGNALKKQQCTYKAEKMSADLTSQCRFFTAAQCAKLKDYGDNSPDPIFIVGLPRAGSTLLEQILASHSMVDGTLELPNILTISQELRRRGEEGNKLGYPDIIAELNEDELAQLGSRYLKETKIHRQGAPFFIDKMPNNFRHIGLIKLILPNAKIIDARRHPAACCFSAFKQLFAEGQEFTYSLDDIAQYYIDYVELMDHWDTVLPGEVLRVHYEDMTSDIESQVERILNYCGLPFEAGCLEFHKTKRAVRTASSEQVRQPIYQSGVDHWQNFGTQLQPLLSTLAPTIKRYEH